MTVEVVHFTITHIVVYVSCRQLHARLASLDPIAAEANRVLPVKVLS